MSCLILLTCEGGDIRGDIAGMSQIGKAGSPTSTPHRGDEETHEHEQVECDLITEKAIFKRPL